MSALGAPSREIELATQLIALRRQWGHCYRISYRHGRWVAERRDNDGQVTGAGVKLLRDAIADDHATRPVPPQHRLPEAPLAAARGHAPHTALSRGRPRAAPMYTDPRARASNAHL